MNQTGSHTYAMLHYQILDLLHACGPMDFSELSQHFTGHIAELTPSVEILHADGLISFSPPSSSPPAVYLKLTPAGFRVSLVHQEAIVAQEEALAEQARLKEQATQKEAEKKAQQRFQNKIAIAQLLVPVITFILGLLVEHFSGFITVLSDLFH